MTALKSSASAIRRRHARRFLSSTFRRNQLDTRTEAILAEPPSQPTLAAAVAGSKSQRNSISFVNLKTKGRVSKGSTVQCIEAGHNGRDD